MSHRSERFVDVVGTVVGAESLKCRFDFLWSSTGRVTRYELSAVRPREDDGHPTKRVVHQLTPRIVSERMRHVTSVALRLERQKVPSANERTPRLPVLVRHSQLRDLWQRMMRHASTGGGHRRGTLSPRLRSEPGPGRP